MINKGIKRGDVFMVDLNKYSGPIDSHKIVKRRPCIIVSNDMCNKTSDICVVVPLSTQSRVKNKYQVLFKFGSTTNCAQCEQITIVDQKYIDKKIGHIGMSTMEQINNALCVQLDLPNYESKNAETYAKLEKKILDCVLQKLGLFTSVFPVGPDEQVYVNGGNSNSVVNPDSSINDEIILLFNEQFSTLNSKIENLMSFISSKNYIDNDSTSNSITINDNLDDRLNKIETNMAAISNLVKTQVTSLDNVLTELLKIAKSASTTNTPVVDNSNISKPITKTEVVKKTNNEENISIYQTVAIPQSHGKYKYDWIGEINKNKNNKSQIERFDFSGTVRQKYTKDKCIMFLTDFMRHTDKELEDLYAISINKLKKNRYNVEKWLRMHDIDFPDDYLEYKKSSDKRSQSKFDVVLNDSNKQLEFLHERETKKLTELQEKYGVSSETLNKWTHKCIELLTENNVPFRYVEKRTKKVFEVK